MKKTKATTTDLRNKAREARKTPLSEARYLSASDVTDPHALIEDLHIYRMELEAQNQELQRIQGELEAVLERYRNLYDFAPVGYLTCDKEGRIQEINLTLCRLLGTTRDAFIEASFYDYVHEQDRDTLYLHLRKLYREKGRRADEFRLVTKKKRVIWVYVESVLEQHSAKGVACRMGLTDITQLKETQQELAESEARFRTLTEHAPDIISRYDRNLRYLYVNPAIEPVADIPARGFIGKSDKELGMPEEFCKRWTEILRRVFKTGQPQTAELDFATANGKRTFELRAVPEEGVEGSIESVMGTAREITERKQAEDTLRRSKELSAALNRINDVMHSSLDSEEIMQQLVSEGARALNCETATLSLRRKKDWVVRYVHGMPDNLVGSVMHDEEERHAVLALETGQPVAVSDAFNDDRFNREHLRRHNIRSVLAVPLIAGGRPLGIIFFNYNSTVHPFADEEVDFARQLSVAASIALENARLYEELRRSEESVRKSMERYRGLYDAISGGVIVQDRNGTIIESNPMARDMLGLTREQIEGLSVQDPPWQAISEDGSPLPGDNHPSMRVLRTGIPVEGQVIGVFNPIIEQYRWLLINTEPILDPKTSQVRGTVSTFLDITDRKMREEELHRLNRTLRALSNSSQAMMRATDESAYMQEVCKIIVEDCGHKMVWIGLAEEDEAKSVRPAAYAGFEQGYLETLRITWADSERGRGPTGTAIRTGRVSMCRNMLTDPNFAPWREQAINRGYASSIVLPLLAEGKAFGAINIYSQDPDPFSEDEVTLLSELADDLAYGIQTLRLRAAQAKAEEALRASEARLSRAQEIAHLGSWELDVANNNLSWSDEVYRIFGLQSKEFGATYEAFLECVHPDDRAAVDAAYSTSLQEGRDTYDVEHRVIRKDTGEIRIVHERCEHHRDTAGRIIRSIGMVQDITERKRADEALKESYEELDRFNRMMVGREVRMIELKKQVNELCAQAGQPLRYQLDFEKEQQ